MKRIFSILTAGLLAMNFLSVAPQKVEVNAASSAPCIEQLDRGTTAINTGNGMLVSWRFLADDPDDAIFKLYRNNELIYTSNSGEATCYLDASGSSKDSYRVDCLYNEKVISSEECKFTSNNSFFEVNLDQPSGSYSPNDCSVGDADGDGQLELFVKWDPSNSKDNSQKGKTDKVYIDCYKLNGTKLWRIDLGVNIRAGAHYTQFLVADFDSDGFAELCCKTADGTKDALGNVIGDGSKDYRNSSGYVLSGPEYYSLFDGRTGAVLDTVNYEPARGTVSDWGDKYGNRVDRFLGATVYLDGVHPSAVTVRGYYTRMTACAYDVVDKKLVKRWYFDTGNSSSSVGYGDGNHNCMPADVDGDGKQELVLGATCLDDNGKVLWNTNKGHGDALHIGDFLPDRNGLEVWVCHEDKPYGVTLMDASNGKIIFHKDGSEDTGRCCADNVWAGNDGAEFWGLNYDVYDKSGNLLNVKRPAINFLSWWDSDLEREILDGYTDSPAKLYKMNESGNLVQLLQTDGYYTCNTTKGTPCLSADIFGDWREELIVRAANGKSIKIYSTTYDTDYRITTLLHDVQYRTQVAGQNIAYNQPPHTSFYLGSDGQLPTRPNVTIVPCGDVSVTKSVNAFETIEAESYDKQTGIKTEDTSGGGQNIGYIENGDSTIYYGIDFGDKTAQSVNFRASSNSGGTVEIYKGNELIGNVNITSTGGFNNYQDFTANLNNSVTGKGTITLKFVGSEGYLFNLDSFVFNTELIPMQGTLITNLMVEDAENRADWSIQSGLKTGDLQFGDRDVTFAEFPENLTGAEYIRTAADSKAYTSNLGTFTAGADMTVYVALDSRVTAIPEWLTSWTKTGLTVTNSNSVVFELYSLDVSKGNTVTLGTNGQSSGCVSYSVFAVEQGAGYIMGDVNMDGVFNVADAVLLQKWLLAVPDTTLANWKAGDLISDNRLDVFDLVMMKRALIEQMEG